MKANTLLGTMVPMIGAPSRRGLLAALLGTALGAGSAHAQEGGADKACAIVLLHGKWGSPRQIGFFGRRLEPLCTVVELEMPWSQRRNYDAPYAEALAEIAAQVKAFREQGFARVLVAGHSFGANAALAYMAERGDADAVIALAPGHAPARMYAQGGDREAVDTARERVAAGRGEDMLRIDDLNQGARRNIRMRADVLLSYFDPQGLGDMPRSTARFRKAVPLLWVVGTNDPLYRAGPQYAFARAPAHPYSQYLEVPAGHVETPDVALPQVLAWIKGLP